MNLVGEVTEILTSLCARPHWRRTALACYQQSASKVTGGGAILTCHPSLASEPSPAGADEYPERANLLAHACQRSCSAEFSPFVGAPTGRQGRRIRKRRRLGWALSVVCEAKRKGRAWRAPT